MQGHLRVHYASIEAAHIATCVQYTCRACSASSSLVLVLYEMSTAEASAGHYLASSHCAIVNLPVFQVSCKPLRVDGQVYHCKWDWALCSAAMELDPKDASVVLMLLVGLPICGGSKTLWALEDHLCCTWLWPVPHIPRHLWPLTY